MTAESNSRFLEVNEILIQGLMTNIDIALIDMPELLLRMKVAHTYSLAELQEILNFVMNKLSKKQGPCIDSASAALYYFPEVFAKPRDEYVAAMLKEIAMDSQVVGGENGYSSVSCYVGNVHTAPITRLLKTYNSDGVHSGEIPAESDFQE